MSNFTTKFKVILIGVITAALAYFGINVVEVQNYEVVRKTVPTVMPTEAVTPTLEPTTVPTASPSATQAPFRRVVTQPVANPTN